jgi:hypothetical protein
MPRFFNFLVPRHALELDKDGAGTTLRLTGPIE